MAQAHPLRMRMLLIHGLADQWTTHRPPHEGPTAFVSGFIDHNSMHAFDFASVTSVLHCVLSGYLTQAQQARMHNYGEDAHNH